MEPGAEIEVKSAIVACEGGRGPLGHPNIYLHIDNDGYVSCPYCSRRYRLMEGVATTKP